MQHDKKMLVLDILDILKEHTNYDHRLKQEEILEILKRDYDMVVERRTISENLDRLIDAGYYIGYDKKVRKVDNKKNIVKTNFYFVNDFDDSELHFLVDAILFSKYIPYSQCKRIIEKISKLGSKYFSSKIKYVKTFPNETYRSQDLFLNIEIVDEAISKNKKIIFNYCNYDINKKLVPNVNSEGKVAEYKVSPYYMVAMNGRYYLICNMAGKENVGIYLLDHIKNAKIVDEIATEKSKVKGLDGGADLWSYIGEHPYMTLGESATVRFEFKKYLLNSVVDDFGKNIIIKAKDENTLYGTITINLKAMKYWAMQFSEGVKILSPKSLVEEIKTLAKNIIKKYEDKEI